MLVEHHTKYKEIHGIDETVWMEKGEHRALHNRLRKEGKCNIPVPELAKISLAARARTGKNKESNKQYNKKNKYQFQFYTTIIPNVRLREHGVYNLKTDNIYISSHFMASNGKKIFYIDEDEP